MSATEKKARPPVPRPETQETEKKEDETFRRMLETIKEKETPILKNLDTLMTHQKRIDYLKEVNERTQNDIKEYRRQIRERQKEIDVITKQMNDLIISENQQLKKE